MNFAGFYRLLLIFIVCFSVSSAQAEGENKAGATKVYSLGEVVVSADMPGADTITTMVVTDEDIERRNAKTLDKALELLPGIDVSKGAKGIPRVNIRGFRSRHTTLLLNGIPINSTYDGQFDPHLIPTENISKIKVSYGNHSVLYGQGGLAGVINIITKQGTPGLHLDASTEMDERGNNYSKAIVSGGQEKVDFFVSVSNMDSDGFLLSDDFTPTASEDGGIRDNGDDKRLSLFGNIDFQLNDELELGLTLESSSGELGTPSSTIDGTIDPFANKYKYERKEDFETVSAQLSMEYHPGKMFGLRAWGFTNNNEQDLAAYDSNTYTTQTAKGNYTRTDETTISGGTLQAGFNFESSGILTVSLSGQKDEYTSDGEQVLKKKNAAVPFNLDNDLEIYSTALEYKLQLLSALDVIMGYSHHWQAKNIGSDDDQGSYMVGAGYELSDNTTLRASYAKKIRFPSIKQLYEPGGAGNANLTTEQSSNYEIGIRQKLFWNMEMDLALFQSDVEDYIEKDNVTNQNMNNEEYQFKGVDIILSKPFLETGFLSIGYSYMETEDKSTGTLRDELNYRPAHKFTVDVNYTWAFGLTAHADYMHVAEQYHYSRTGPLQKGELDDYSIVNLKLEQKLYKDNFFVYLGADNLLDEAYEESYGYPQSGRTAYVGLRLKY